MRVNKTHIISLNIRKSVHVWTRASLLAVVKKSARTFFLSSSSPPSFRRYYVQVSIRCMEVLALCTDKLRSSMLYDRFIHGRLVRRFKNGRCDSSSYFLFHAPFYFLISRHVSNAKRLEVVFLF